ncbi:MAG: PEP-CTERM sorting domain-containing protein [Akkermansiaceae bacterium]|nr:PEP-CTERM sorting domain-containing protein [Akkermansiaceae bacterium]
MVSSIPAFAEPPVQVEIVGTPANHTVKWTTRLEYAYRIEASPDLDSWIDPGLVFPGIDGWVEHGFRSEDDRWFYRVEEALDTDKVAFLTLPTPGQEVLIDDGVCFAFNLDPIIFPQFPHKIRLYKRIYQSGAAWELIGAVDDFLELYGVRFARGSVVWLPEEPGDYEVKATAVDAADQVIGNATRPVFVIPNSPPVVVIDSGPATLAAEEQIAEFTTAVSDLDGDTASANYPQSGYPTNTIYMPTANWTPGTHTIAVMIRDQVDALGYLALVDVVIAGTPPPVGSPFADALVADIADEATAPVSNARFTGAEDSSGFFDFGVARGLQLDQGVVLTTGKAISWNAGDTSEITEMPWGLPGDEELFYRVAGSFTKDAAVLEFDVFCVNGQLVIDYQFGSEEYDEYVILGFNDAFSLTVSGLVGSGEIIAYSGTFKGTPVPITGTGELVIPFSMMENTVPIDRLISLDFRLIGLTADFSVTLDRIAAVPEPGSLGLFAGGMALLLTKRRRWRSVG